MSYTVNTKMYFQERDEADIFMNTQTRKQESYLLVVSRLLRFLYLFFFCGGCIETGFLCVTQPWLHTCFLKVIFN